METVRQTWNKYNWNGAPCEITFHWAEMIEVKDPPTHWQNAHIGETRQVIQVRQGNSRFFIDNHDGTGFLKVTNGGGIDWGHKGFGSLILVGGVLPSEEIRELNREQRDADKAKEDAKMKAEFPELYEKQKMLEQFIRSKYK